MSLDGVQILNFLHDVNMFAPNGAGFLKKMLLGEVSSLSLPSLLPLDFLFVCCLWYHEPEHDYVCTVMKKSLNY